MADQQTMVAEPQVETEKQHKKKPKKQPRFHVMLWDDSDHSYDYVVLMMKQIFRHPMENFDQNLSENQFRHKIFSARRRHRSVILQFMYRYTLS